MSANPKQILQHLFLRTCCGVFLSFLFSLGMISLFGRSWADEILWPIQYPKQISSSFGEPRPGRFHFGVDCKSGGVTGKKVISVGDGYISRVRTSPFGYGKALYIKLDSGETAVYGHLSGFRAEIENRLFTMRIARRSYDIDWYPDPNEFRVTKGQHIGYSGDTGSGPPHLHFELRDGNNVPFNPLKNGMVIYDTAAPVIKSVVLFPLDKTSSVNGFRSVQWHDFSSSETEPFVLQGSVGLAVSVYDKVNKSRNRLGIYTITLVVDSTTVFSKSYDRLSYDLLRFGSLDYLTVKQDGTDDTVSALFRKTGNTFDFYEGSGVLCADVLGSEEERILIIRALDNNNNSTERSLPVIFGSRPVFTHCGFTGENELRIAGLSKAGQLDRIEIWEVQNGGSGQPVQTLPVSGTSCDVKTVLEPSRPTVYKIIIFTQDSMSSMPAIITSPYRDAGSETTKIETSAELYHDSIVVRIVSTDHLSSLPAVQIESDDMIKNSTAYPVPGEGKTWESAFDIPHRGENRIHIGISGYDKSLESVSDSTTLECTVCGVTEQTRVYAPDSLFSITVPPESLFRPAPFTIDIGEAQPHNGLIGIMEAYTVIFGDEPLKEYVTISIEPQTNEPDKAALYRYNDKKGWEFLSSDRKGVVFNGKLKGSGLYTVFADTLKPLVRPVTPRPGETITSQRPLLRAHVEDKGSGIEGSDSIEMSINGIEIYGEYDYEADRISYRLHDSLRSGMHTVKVKVTDRVGNSEMATWQFRIK